MYLYGQSRDKIENDIPTNEKKHDYKIYVYKHYWIAHKQAIYFFAHIFCTYSRDVSQVM